MVFQSRMFLNAATCRRDQLLKRQQYFFGHFETSMFERKSTTE